MLKDKPSHQQGPLPFAREMYVRIPYVDQFQQSAPATQLFGVTSWALNSLFDPDQTGSGHQPYQYDQLTGIYKKYMVYKAKVDLVFSNPTADDLIVAYSVRTANLAGINGSSIASIGERRNTKSFAMVNTGNQKKSISFFVDMATSFAQPNVLFKANEDKFAAAYNANPTNILFLEVATACTTALGTTGVNVQLRITYYARLYDYYTQAQS